MPLSPESSPRAVCSNGWHWECGWSVKITVAVDGPAGTTELEYPYLTGAEDSLALWSSQADDSHCPVTQFYEGTAGLTGEGMGSAQKEMLV